MSNDLLKLHLSAVNERANKQLSFSGRKNDRNKSGVEKSASKIVTKAKKTKTEVNYLGMN